jgi:hypothetical protein
MRLADDAAARAPREKSWADALHDFQRYDPSPRSATESGQWWSAPRNGEMEIVPVDLKHPSANFSLRSVHWPIGPWDKCWRDFEKDGDWNDALYGVCALTLFYAKALRILAEFSRRSGYEHPASTKSSITTALFQRWA